VLHAEKLNYQSHVTCFLEDMHCNICLHLHGANFDGWDVKEHF